MVWELINPASPRFVQYITNRDFNGDPETSTAGDLGPEGIVFVKAKQSPNGHPLLLVANEVSHNLPDEPHALARLKPLSARGSRSDLGGGTSAVSSVIRSGDASPLSFFQKHGRDSARPSITAPESS